MARLSGSEVVPPVKTEARGTANFDLHPDGKSLKFNLTVRNLNNITGAAIYLGTAGKEGPLVVKLYPGSQTSKMKEGKFSGTLVEGIITAANLGGPLKGKPLSDLVKEIRADNAYIKVLTQQNPGGELRGAITWRPT